MTPLDHKLAAAVDVRTRKARSRTEKGQPPAGPARPVASHPCRLSMWRRGSRKGGT